MIKLKTSAKAVRKLILKNSLSPGDIVMLTAAVRDLHRCYPKQFSTDVRTPFPQLWENNPHVTHHAENDPEVEVVECHYPLINRSNHAPYHVIHGFIEFLNQRLKLSIRPTLFKGDIHLSAEEKSWSSQVHELVGEEIPFWIIAAGGKHDVTIKWWDTGRYQEVVDHFQGKIQFVQVGASDHYHPPLKGVIDLRGKTDIRQFVRLVYHAQGVVCPVTFPMHLAAAVDVKPGAPKNRACVVVAGGREPAQWEAYPHHQFLHTNGALLCCDHGGCWKSRTLPLGDGDERDNPANLCVNVVGKLPRCMDMITAADVAQRIKMYFHGGALQYLTRPQAQMAEKAVNYGSTVRWGKGKLEQHAFQQALRQFIESPPPSPPPFSGRGIVLCQTGEADFPGVWICINMLRKTGCSLPIQIWQADGKTVDARTLERLKLMGAEYAEWKTCKDDSIGGFRHLELKPYALANCPFEEVLLLDANTIPTANPDFLFEAESYRKNGAIFWPGKRQSKPGKIWKLCETPFPSEPGFDTAQMMVNKTACWRALSLCLWYGEHADFFTTKDRNEIIHAAFAKTGTGYTMPQKISEVLGDVAHQFDFQGHLIFQNYLGVKWKPGEHNLKIEGLCAKTIASHF